MKIQRIITWSKLMALPLLLVACTESTELDNIEQTSEEVYPELDFSCESPSRAVVSSFEPGAKIGVFVTDKGTTNGYGGNASNMNITYTLNGDSYWEAGYNTALTNSEANVYGYGQTGERCGLPVHSSSFCHQQEQSDGRNRTEPCHVIAEVQL